MSDTVIASEVLWRKAEISALASIVKGAPNAQAADAMRRAMYCAIYAHWEGAVKIIARSYADSVRKSGMRLEDLAICFRAMIAKNSFESVPKSKTLTPYMQALAKFEENKLNYVFFDFNQYIRAEGNLTSNVLKEIHSAIGIGYGNYFKLKEKYIDGQLVMRRNLIAHGEKVPVEQDIFDQAVKEVPEMFTEFSRVVIEAFQSRAFQANI